MQKPLVLPPQDQVFWYLHEPDIKPLTHDIKTNVVVIGGGMAGLSAAQSFHAQGLKVVLIEKNYCGAGASGKSSGFITPDSELPLDFFNTKYGPEATATIKSKIRSFLRARQKILKKVLWVNTTRAYHWVTKAPSTPKMNCLRYWAQLATMVACRTREPLAFRDIVTVTA